MWVAKLLLQQEFQLKTTFITKVMEYKVGLKKRGVCVP